MPDDTSEPVLPATPDWENPGALGCPTCEGTGAESYVVAEGEHEGDMWMRICTDDFHMQPPPP